jgi:hypothetical protein
MVDHSYHNNHGHDRRRREKQEQDCQKQGKSDQRQAGRLTGKKRKEKMPRRRRGKTSSHR